MSYLCTLQCLQEEISQRIDAKNRFTIINDKKKKKFLINLQNKIKEKIHHLINYLYLKIVSNVLLINIIHLIKNLHIICHPSIIKS